MEYKIVENNTQKNSDGTPYYPYETHMVVRTQKLANRLLVKNGDTVWHGATLHVDDREGCENYLAELDGIDYEKIARKFYSEKNRGMIDIDGQKVDKLELLRVLGLLTA